MIHTMFTSVFCIFTTGKMYSRVSKMKTYLLSTDQQKPLQIETALFFSIQALSNGLFKKHIQEQKLSHAIKLVLSYSHWFSFEKE